MMFRLALGRTLLVNSQALNWIDPGYIERNATHSNLSDFSNCVLSSHGNALLHVVERETDTVTNESLFLTATVILCFAIGSDARIDV